MTEEIKTNMTDHEEDNPFQGVAKSSVKLKKSTRGLSWEIKVVTGEENLVDGLMQKAVEVHKKLIKELNEVEKDGKKEK